MIFPCRNWLSIFSLRWLYRLLALLCYYKDLQLCAKSSSKTQIVDIFLPFIMFFFLFVEISGYIGKPTYLIIYHFRFGLFILILIFIYARFHIFYAAIFQCKNCVFWPDFITIIIQTGNIPGNYSILWHESSPSQMFPKIGVLKNFAKFIGNQMCWSLFLNNSTSWRRTILLKMRIQHTCFTVNFAKFQEHFLTEFETFFAHCRFIFNLGLSIFLHHSWISKYKASKTSLSVLLEWKKKKAL